MPVGKSPVKRGAALCAPCHHFSNMLANLFHSDGHASSSTLPHPVAQREGQTGTEGDRHTREGQQGTEGKLRGTEVPSCCHLDCVWAVLPSTCCTTTFRFVSVLLSHEWASKGRKIARELAESFVGH